MSQFVSTYTALQTVTHIHPPINWVMSPTSGDTPVLDKAVTSVTATLNLIAHHTCDVQIQIGDYVQAFHMASFGTGGAGVLYNFTIPTELLGQVSKWVSAPVSLTVLRSDWPPDEVRFRYLTFTMTVNFSASSGSISSNYTGGKQLVFGKQPPAVSAASTTYTMRMDAVDGQTGAVDVSYASQLRLQLIQLSSGAALPLSQWLSGSSSTATDYLFAMTSGSTTVTLNFSSLTANVPCYFVVVPATSANIGNGTSTQTRRAGSSLVWSTEPATANTVGAALATSPVLQVYTSGSFDTSDSSTVITLTVNRADGSTPADSNALLGSLTGTLSGGTVTFTGLTITQPGGYTLTATGTGYAESTTDVFYGVGFSVDENVPAMRQDVGYDGTVWRKTTGLSPSFVVPTTNELVIINGDLASAQEVTTDGLRITTPYIAVVKKVIVKYNLSTLTGAPTIKIYTSPDATDPTNGTWVLQTTITPAQLIEIQEYKPPTALWTRGVWVTLDANGGAATCSWRSFQVMGNYVQPSVDFIDVTTGTLIADEEYLSIPKPISRISGASTQTRNVILRNNTNSPITARPTVTYAHSDGDTLADQFHCIILDSNGVEITSDITLPANGNVFVTLQYTITAAENDSTGKHYIRFDLATGPAAPAVNKLLTIWSTNGTAKGRRLNILTGATSSQNTLPGPQDAYMDYAGGLGGVMYAGTAGTTLTFYPLYTPTHSSDYSLVSTASATLNSWSSTTDMTRCAFNEDHSLMITRANSTTAWRIASHTSLVDTTLYSNLASSFTLPTAATGDKLAIGGQSGYNYITNGTSGAVTLSRISTTGTTLTTVDISAWVGGGSLGGIWYDKNAHLIYLVQLVSGGSRKLAWYSATSLLQIGQTTNTDQTSLEAYGGFSSGSTYYLLFGSRYLYSYTTRYSGGTLVVDFGTGANGTTLGPAFLFNE